jgi:Na+/proline symporter
MLSLRTAFVSIIVVVSIIIFVVIIVVIVIVVIIIVVIVVVVVADIVVVITMIIIVVVITIVPIIKDGIFSEFDRQIREELEPQWHRISFKTKQLLGDLRTLRKLLQYLTRYDCVTMYWNIPTHRIFCTEISLLTEYFVLEYLC